MTINLGYVLWKYRILIIIIEKGKINLSENQLLTVNIEGPPYFIIFRFSGNFGMASLTLLIFYPIFTGFGGL